MFTLRYLLFSLLAGAALALAACGDDDTSPGQQDEVTCVPLTAFRSYRFQARGVQEVQATVTPPAGSTPREPAPFRFVLNVQGEVQGEDRVSAVVTQGDAGTNPGSTIVIGDTMYVLLNGQWVANAIPPVLPIPYTPNVTCQAIAPGLSVAGLPSTPDNVNGIPSLRYHLEVPNDFFGRHANFGPSSDLARLIETVTVDIWLAEDGNYPTKVEVSGTAQYPNESKLVAEVSYEISDVGASDIQITPPATPG